MREITGERYWKEDLKVKTNQRAQQQIRGGGTIAFQTRYTGYTGSCAPSRARIHQPSQKLSLSFSTDFVICQGTAAFSCAGRVLQRLDLSYTRTTHHYPLVRGDCSFKR